MNSAEVFRLGRYLARIGFVGEARADFGTLAAIQGGHVEAIPFEGIDPLLGRAVQLDLDWLQDKIVDGRRGGYCFEQNTLLRAALEAIGFRVTPLIGRVLWMSPPDSPPGPRTHMLLKVDLPEGPFLADVGFGACLLDTPLRLEAGAEQRTRMGTFQLSEASGVYTLVARQGDGWRGMYSFTLERQFAADYELGNWFTSTNPAAPFLSMLIMERLGKDRRYKLVNRTFVVEARDGIAVSEQVLDSAEALGRVLDETFKITPPVAASVLFDRIGQ